MTLTQLGFAHPASWLMAIGEATLALAVMLAYSPLADRLATRLVRVPPRLQAFRAIQRSWVSLAVGVVVAWVLGGFIEEFLLRGVVLRFGESFLRPSLGPLGAAAVAIVLAALFGGLAHLYQGPRGALIIFQLSVLFGVLYVISGGNLWATILCHGAYDTIAFVRFARGRSKYSHLEGGSAE